jgi:hypothetical protein
MSCGTYPMPLPRVRPSAAGLCRSGQRPSPTRCPVVKRALGFLPTVPAAGQVRRRERRRVRGMGSRTRVVHCRHAAVWCRFCCRLRVDFRRSPSISTQLVQVPYASGKTVEPALDRVLGDSRWLGLIIPRSPVRSRPPPLPDSACVSKTSTPGQRWRGARPRTGRYYLWCCAIAATTSSVRSAAWAR